MSLDESSCASRDIFNFVKENFEKLQGLFKKALEEYFSYSVSSDFFLLRNLCRITAHDASPVTDIVVRAISTNRSIPAAIATPSTGMPAEANTIAISAKDPPGIAGVPMDTMVDEMAMAR